MASLAKALADALRRRGVAAADASLAAEAAVAIFRIAFERWVNGASEKDLSQLMCELLARLKALAVAGP